MRTDGKILQWNIGDLVEMFPLLYVAVKLDWHFFGFKWYDFVIVYLNCAADSYLYFTLILSGAQWTYPTAF